jgi:hypothetical protein
MRKQPTPPPDRKGRLQTKGKIVPNGEDDVTMEDVERVVEADPPPPDLVEKIQEAVREQHEDS